MGMGGCPLPDSFQERASGESGRWSQHISTPLYTRTPYLSGAYAQRTRNVRNHEEGSDNDVARPLERVGGLLEIEWLLCCGEALLNHEVLYTRDVCMPVKHPICLFRRDTHATFVLVVDPVRSRYCDLYLLTLERRPCELSGDSGAPPFDAAMRSGLSVYFCTISPP